jgi:hypothetical protein
MDQKLFITSLLFILQHLFTWAQFDGLSQRSFAASGFYSVADVNSINSIRNHLNSEIFIEEESAVWPGIIRASRNVLCGGTPSVSNNVGFYFGYTNGIYPEWLNSTCNGELELLMNWNKSSDTCFVEAFSPICHNSSVQIPSQQVLGNVSSDLMERGFAPAVRYPFNHSILEILTTKEKNFWHSLAIVTYCRNYSAVKNSSNDTLKMIVPLQSNSWVNLESHYLKMTIDELINNWCTSYKTSDLGEYYSNVELNSLYKPLETKNTYSEDGTYLGPITAVHPIENVQLRLCYTTKLDSGSTNLEIPYFFAFHLNAIEVRLSGEKQFYLSPEEFWYGINEIGFDKTLYQSAFKFSLLSHFKINQYWDGTQLD